MLTNKYAEGYPGKRYYGGCEYVDMAEQLAIERAKKLFGAEYANVQPHSGSQANQAVYMAVLKPGDTILGMSLAARRPPHPRRVGQLLRASSTSAIAYGLDENEEIDYDAGGAPGARSTSRKMIVAGASAYSLRIDWKRFREIADSVGALPDGGHGALRRPGRGGRVPEPGRHRRLRHHHHAQDPARPARRHDPRARQSTRKRSTRRSSPASRAAR